MKLGKKHSAQVNRSGPRNGLEGCYLATLECGIGKGRAATKGHIRDSRGLQGCRHQESASALRM